MMKYTQVSRRYRKCPIVTGKQYKISRIIRDNGNYFSNKSLEEIKTIIETFVDDLIWLYENHFGPKGSFSDSTKYYFSELDENERGNEEKLLGYLRYMADRWSADIRIRLMIDLVRPNYVPKNRKKDFILPRNFNE